MLNDTPRDERDARIAELNQVLKERNNQPWQWVRMSLRYSVRGFRRITGEQNMLDSPIMDTRINLFLESVTYVSLKGIQANGKRLDSLQRFWHYDFQNANFQRSYLNSFLYDNNGSLPCLNFKGANFEKSTFSGNIQKVDLQGANLEGADLSHADLSDANLRGANLQGACLIKTYEGRDGYGEPEITTYALKLTRADITGANFQNTEWYNLNLDENARSEIVATQLPAVWKEYDDNLEKNSVFAPSTVEGKVYAIKNRFFSSAQNQYNQQKAIEDLRINLSASDINELKKYELLCNYMNDPANKHSDFYNIVEEKLGGRWFEKSNNPQPVEEAASSSSLSH
ncbi:MAG: pentapeptide repeat-containing protein [Gammaproteobacteria bacterium]